MYSLCDLETFIAIVENQGVVVAAKAQGLSPATVSHRLNKLEKALNTVLIFRDSRRMRLSPAGEVFYQRVVAILEALYDAEHQIGARGSAISGVLRVTIPPWVFSKFVLPALAAFESNYPDLKLDFMITDQFVNVVDDAQDVAIRVGQMADSNLLSRKIARNSRILCASPAYLAKHGTPKSITDLTNHQWVCLPWQRQLKFKDNDRVINHSVTTQLTISNSDNMTQAAVAGLGIAIKSRLAIQDELAAGQLVEILPNTLLDDDAPVWFLKPQNSLVTRKTEVFYEFMKSLFQ